VYWSNLWRILLVSRVFPVATSPIIIVLRFTGYAPVTESLPYEWYITPNIRVITIKDFRRFTHEAGFRILKEVAISTTEDQWAGKIIRILPTLRASHGIFLIGKKEAK